MSFLSSSKLSNLAFFTTTTFAALNVANIANAAAFNVSGIFEDGATLSGSFELENGTVGDFNLATSAGLLPATTYSSDAGDETFFSALDDSSFYVIFRIPGGLPEQGLSNLRLVFPGFLETFAGGVGITDGEGREFAFIDFGTVTRSLNEYSGEIVSEVPTAVPEPSLLLGMGLAIAYSILSQQKKKI